MVKGRKIFFRATETEYNYIEALQEQFKLSSFAEAMRWVIHQNIRLTQLLEERQELVKIIDRLTRKVK
jgi:hypothetical protein